MSLTSSSTLADAINQYNDNLSWEGNTTKAGLALEAVRFILANRPKVIATNDRNINYETLLGEKEKLETFVGKFSSSVNRCSFTRGHALLI